MNELVNWLFYEHILWTFLIQSTGHSKCFTALVTFKHWWQRLPCKVLACSSGAIWGFWATAKKSLPRNRISLDLLVGPFSPEHPRGMYIFSPHPPTTEQVLQAICGCLTTGPVVPLAPFCPTNPISPCSPVGPVSPRWPWWPLLPWREAASEQVCKLQWIVVLVVGHSKHLMQTFKHFQC